MTGSIHVSSSGQKSVWTSSNRRSRRVCRVATQEKLIFIMLVISYTCFTGWTFYPILIQC